MIDGSRKRRDTDNPTKNRWYATHRAQRFRRRFGWSLELESQYVRMICGRCESRPPSQHPGQSVTWRNGSP